MGAKFGEHVLASVAEKKRKRRGRPPSDAPRTASGRLSRAKHEELIPIPEQVKRGLGDGLGGIDDPISRLQRLGLITDNERKIADSIEALYISFVSSSGLPRMTGSALEPRIAGHRRENTTERDIVIANGWKALSEALRGVQAYEVIIASACQRNQCPDSAILLDRFKRGVNVAKDIIVVG